MSKEEGASKTEAGTKSAENRYMASLLKKCEEGYFDKTEKDFELEKSSGTKLLISLLEKKPQSKARDDIIALAKTGQYHSFYSDAAFPTILLIKYLTEAGFADLASMASEDEFEDDYE